MTGDERGLVIGLSGEWHDRAVPPSKAPLAEPTIPDLQDDHLSRDESGLTLRRSPCWQDRGGG